MRLLKIVVVIFFFVDLFLAVTLVVGRGGIINYWRVKGVKARLSHEVERLEKENIGLSEQIRSMRHNRVFQEKVVREVLHLAGKDEIFYMVRR